MTFLTKRGVYAAIIMLEISKGDKTTPVSIKSIADTLGKSKNYLEQAINALRKAGLIKALRGPNGGYFLLKKPNEITFGDIFNATEGELVMTNLDIKNENLKRFFDDLNNKIKKTLEIPLSDYEKFVQTKEKFLNFVI